MRTSNSGPGLTMYVSAAVGSERGGGTRRWNAAVERLAAFFAILAGKGERLAAAYVKGKEAETDEKESDAAIAKEKVKQEQLETLDKAMEVAKELQNQIADLRTDIPADRKAALLEQHFMPSMERMGILLLENNLELELSPDRATEA